MAAKPFLLPFWVGFVFITKLLLLTYPTTKVVIIFTTPNFFEKILTVIAKSYGCLCRKTL